MSARRLHRPAGLSLAGLWWLTLVFLYAPLAVVVLFSFNAANTSAEFVGFSLQWYAHLFSNEVIQAAMRNSLILATSSALIGTTLGTCLGYGIYKHRGPWLKTITWIVYLPIVIPDIVFGIAEMAFFATISQRTGLLSPSLLTMIIAHVTFQTPYVALVVYSRLVGLDRTIFEAAQDLYASPWQRAYAFVLPVVRPAVISGFFLAFTLSIDDFVISFFTAGPNSATLPIYIWGAIKKGVSPEINAIASLLIGVVMIMALGSVAVDRLRSRPRRRARNPSTSTRGHFAQ